MSMNQDVVFEALDINELLYSCWRVSGVVGQEGQPSEQVEETGEEKPAPVFVDGEEQRLADVEEGGLAEEQPAPFFDEGEQPPIILRLRPLNEVVRLAEMKAELRRRRGPFLQQLQTRISKEVGAMGEALQALETRIAARRQSLLEQRSAFVRSFERAGKRRARDQKAWRERERGQGRLAHECLERVNEAKKMLRRKRAPFLNLLEFKCRMSDSAKTQGKGVAAGTRKKHDTVVVAQLKSRSQVAPAAKKHKQAAPVAFDESREQKVQLLIEKGWKPKQAREKVLLEETRDQRNSEGPTLLTSSTPPRKRGKFPRGRS